MQVLGRFIVIEALLLVVAIIIFIEELVLLPAVGIRVLGDGALDIHIDVQHLTVLGILDGAAGI